MALRSGEVTEDEINALIQQRGVAGLRDLIEPLANHLAPSWYSSSKLIFTSGAERCVFRALLEWVERGGLERLQAAALTPKEAKRKLKRLSARGLDPDLPGVLSHLAVRVYGEGASVLLEHLFFGQPREDVSGRDLGYETHGVVEAISQYVEVYPQHALQFTNPAAAAIARGVGFERDCEALLQALPDPEEEEDDELFDESLIFHTDEDHY